MAAAKLGDRYISDRFLPDKAVDLVDEAASRVRLQATLPPQAIRDIEVEIRKVKQEKEAVVKSQEFEKAAAVRDREEKLRLEKQRLEAEWAEKRANADKVIKVTEEDIAHIVSAWTHIPVSKLAQAETEKASVNEGATPQARRRPGSGHRSDHPGDSPLACGGSRTPSAPSDRSSSWDRPAWARPNSRAPWRSFLFDDGEGR